MIFHVAGHGFEDRIDAICTKLLPNGEPCGCAWQSIRHCRTDEYIGKPDIAHIGNSTANEIHEINLHATREDEMRERAWSAAMDLGSGA